MKKYVLVPFPKIQEFMDYPEWKDCVLCQGTKEHPVEDSTYAVPTDLYLKNYATRMAGKTILTKYGAKLKVAGYNSELDFIIGYDENEGWNTPTEEDIILIPKTDYIYVDIENICDYEHS